jgi:nucleoside-diphosphate-sugar epimerase
MNKILITGADSFIGTNFLKYSANKYSEEVSLIVNKPEEIDFSKFDVVLHLAAIVHRSKKISKKDYLLVNRDLCIKVAENAKKAGVKHFIFLSTVKVYGKYIPGSDPWNESSTCFPDDEYGKSKYEAEIALRDLNNSEFTVSIIRTPIVYGDRVKANMLKLIRLIQTCKILPFRKIKNHRHFTYVENLVGFIDKIIEIRVSGIFIAMDNDGLSSTELICLLSKYLNKRLILFKLPSFFIEAGFVFIPGFFNSMFGSLKLDNTNTKRILNYDPPFTTEEGIKKMIISLKKNK